MKTRKLILTGLLIVITVSLMFTLSSCNKLNKYAKMINKSVDQVVSIELDIQMSDQSQLVYEYNNKITITDNKAHVEVTTSSLNSSFELASTTSTEDIENVNRKDLFQIDLNHKYLVSYEKEKNIVTCEVSKENIVNVLKNSHTNLDIAENAKLVLTFENKRLMTISCKYQTSTAKDVEINAKYTYE